MKEPFERSRIQNQMVECPQGTSEASITGPVKKSVFFDQRLYANDKRSQVYVNLPSNVEFQDCKWCR